MSRDETLNDHYPIKNIESTHHQIKQENFAKYYFNTMEEYTLTNYIISKAAAERIFGKRPKEVTVEGDRVTVKFTDNSSTETEVMQFKKHFAEYRKKKAEKVTIRRNSFTNAWYSTDGYTIDVQPNKIDCDCGDWKTQHKIGIKTPCCKHIYGVLNKMGYTSLKEYLGKK